MTTASALVLVVEDEDTIRHVLEEAFTECGYEVATAATGGEAEAILDVDGRNCSALVTDINLPGTTCGWDLARRAREINEALPVIYISGGSAHEWVSQGVSNSQIMPKPFAVAQVVAAVSQLINAAANAAMGKAQ